MARLSLPCCPPVSSSGRSNYTPVGKPRTGKVYVGRDSGVCEITPPASLPGTPTFALLYSTVSARENLKSPPALDTANGSIVFLAARGQRPTLYVVGFNGVLKWKKDYLQIGRGRARNVPPVIDANGNIYVVVKKALFAFDKNGNQLFTLPTSRQFQSARSPPTAALRRLRRRLRLCDRRLPLRSKSTAQR